MKKLKHLLSPRFVILWVFALIIAFTIPEFTKPAMSQTEAIVNMLCIDLVDNKFEIATSVLTPSQDKSSNYQIYTGTGASVGEAVENVSLSIGKEMGFAQCEIMAFGENLCYEGVLSSLDYLTRTRKVGRNAILINFTGKSKDFAETTAKISKERTLKLENIMNFDKRYVLSRDSNIDSFYKGYFSEISLGIMPQVKLETTEQDTAIEVQANSSDNSTPSSTQNEEKKYLVNDGTMSVFKQGKKVLQVEPEMVQKINLFLNLSQQGTLKVENVTDHLYKNATIIFDLSNKEIKLSPSFENGKPKYNVEISLTVLVEEVMEENPEKVFLRRNKEFLTKTAVEKLKQTIKNEMETVITYCQENEIDLLNVYRQFSRKKYKEFKSYYEQTKEKYLNYIDYEIDVKVQSAY